MNFDYKKDHTEWFVYDRFGMFIHWGLYAMPARHEWVRTREKMTPEQYLVYFDHFEPDLFTPGKWARSAAAAGMKYMVITTRHHEGFCLWDTKYTDFKVTNTSVKRDLLREVVDAFRAEGIRIGFYYSLLDWHHPDFTIDSTHPFSELPKDEIARINASRNMHRYSEYMRNQVRELLTNYGKIDILWFDFSHKEKGHKEWESEKMVEMIRSLQPEIILNNRLDLPGSGDVVTPEQYVPANGMRDEDGTLQVWEGCQTFSGSWGYYRDEHSWKSAEMLVQMLINHVSRGGNLLLNVGPNARGEFDSRAQTALSAIGEWMQRHKRSIYGCTIAPADIKEAENCRYTYNPNTNRLYVHVMAWPVKELHLPGLQDRIEYAQLLNDGSEIMMRGQNQEIHAGLTSEKLANVLTLELPPARPNVIVPVIELFLK